MKRFIVLACFVACSKNFFHKLVENGVYIAPSSYETWFITDALSYADLDETIQAIDKVTQEI